MSRSPCIAAAALANVQGCSADEALTRVARSGAVDVMPGLWAEVKRCITSTGKGPCLKDP